MLAGVAPVADTTTRWRRALALYARSFVWAGAMFTIPMALANAAFLGPAHAFDAVLQGIIFGAGMSAVLVTAALIATRRMPPGALDIPQRRTVVVQGSPVEVLRWVTESLGRLPRAHAPYASSLRMTAGTTTGISMWSFGEIITARIEPSAEAGVQRVQIEGRPRVRWTLVDYGASAKNVDTLETALSVWG